VTDPARQPWLHDLVCALSATTQVWCGPDGDVGAAAGPRGAEGVYEGDVRVLSAVLLDLDGVRPVPVLTAPDGADGQLAVAVARHLGDPAPDPTVRVERRRRLAGGRLEERVTLRSAATVAVRTLVRVRLVSDLAPMDDVKQGRATRSLAPGAPLGWSGPDVRVEVGAGGADVVLDETGAELRWPVELAPGQAWTATWWVRAHDAAAVLQAPPAPAGWGAAVRIDSDDVRLQRWVSRALADLEALRLAPVASPADVVVGAGAPWYLTLFGRDSLWTAQLLLPLGTDLAASTLRALAARQGRRDDPGATEQPGKVLHELRRAPADWGEFQLPPVYYGTVDATSLWVRLLHDAWRAGLPDAEVEALLPQLEAALAWQEGPGDADGDGFLEYVDTTGSGLANQGWKDSGDSVQWRAGGLATAPIALCEVQGYAYAAAVGGAELLEAFGRPAAGHRAWARRLRTAFRERFWVGGPQGWPAIALDARKRPVDSLTSNIGHLLGTGLLDAGEEAVVAGHLASPALAAGFGLRTLSSDDAGFSPLSYHGGSVWAHDTAIAVAGLVRGGFDAEAAVLVDGLLAAAESFAYRVPELHSGDARTDVPAPVPYPAACRPQAWSAAAAVAVAAACAEATARGGTALPRTRAAWR